MKDRSPAAKQKLVKSRCLSQPLRAGIKQAFSLSASRHGWLHVTYKFQGSLAGMEVRRQSFLKSASRFAQYVLVTKGAKTSRVGMHRAWTSQRLNAYWPASPGHQGDAQETAQSWVFFLFFVLPMSS